MTRDNMLLMGRDYLAGATLLEVAHQHHVSMFTVRAALVRLDIPRRHQGPRGPRFPERHALAVELYRQGLSLVAIGLQMGVSRQRIEQMLKPDKTKARRQTLYAIRTGRLIAPESCGCGAKLPEAHHPDYSKPLEVEWLCHDCHMEAHDGRLYVTVASRKALAVKPQLHEVDA